MNKDIGKYLGIYFAFGIGSSALVVVQTLILWIFCSIEVSVFLLTSFGFWSKEWARNGPHKVCH